MIEVVKLNKNNSKEAIIRAKKVLLAGEVLVFPTDTIYGFLCNAKNKNAVAKIFQIKKRSKSKPISVFVKDIKTAKKIANINKKQEGILKKKWPGSFTAVLEKKGRIKIYGSARKTIGIRIPNYEFLNKLLQKLNFPVSQTSVNISNKPILRNAQEIIRQFGKEKHKPDLIIDAGVLKKGKPSKVLDLTTSKLKVLRK